MNFPGSREIPGKLIKTLKSSRIHILEENRDEKGYNNENLNKIYDYLVILPTVMNKLNRKKCFFLNLSSNLFRFVWMQIWKCILVIYLTIIWCQFYLKLVRPNQSEWFIKSLKEGDEHSAHIYMKSNKQLEVILPLLIIIQ